MALEIERRFLVKGNEWKAISLDSQHFRQGYLTTSIQNWTVRVRIMGKEKAWLTLKYPAEKIARHEFEYLIPIKDAEEIWERTPHKLFKTRYHLDLKEGNWIIDCFEESNDPLVIAEVELVTAEQNIPIPNWCFNEITNNKQLTNAALAQKPIRTWTNEDLMTINLN